MNRCKRRSPCSDCPFRKDAKLALWEPSHYIMLLENERNQEEIWTAKVFACHKDKDREPASREYCVGWLIHQRKDGVPNKALRMALVNPAAVAQLNEATLPEGVELYETVHDLVKENILADVELHPDRYADAYAQAAAANTKPRKRRAKKKSAPKT